MFAILPRSVGRVAGTISAAQRLDNTAPKKLRSVGDALSYLTCPGVEPTTSCADSDAFKLCVIKTVLFQFGKMVDPGIDTSLVHKKIRLASDLLAWEHERFSIRRLHAVTLSSIDSYDVSILYDVTISWFDS